MWKVFKRPGRQTSRDSSNSDSQDRGGRSRLSQQISQGMNIHQGNMAQDPASIHNRNNRDDSTVASERSFSGYQAKHNVTKRGDGAGRYVLVVYSVAT